MQEAIPTNEVQRGEPQGTHGVPSQAETRPPFATAGSEVLSPHPARHRAPSRNVRPNIDSIADAMLPPRPADLPRFLPVPVVTNAQRRRLKRAIEALRDEA